MAWDSDNWLEGGSAVSGAASGAATGFALTGGNPIGIGIGAAVGGITSLITSSTARKKQEEAEATAKRQIEEKRRKNLLDRFMARKQEESLATSRPQGRGKSPKAVGVNNVSVESQMAQQEKMMTGQPAGGVAGLGANWGG